MYAGSSDLVKKADLNTPRSVFPSYFATAVAATRVTADTAAAAASDDSGLGPVVVSLSPSFFRVQD